ncbi:hypothetical protein LMG3431_02330 [Achromobacter pestifer]|uniref:Uncharacterized protein n=1 Tax=Achromobacter pestifer TaxID=1353889 RepID=A0A6S6YTM0_9BURK|nr:hypothetical protein LMG3431_02330 [Achromobacter pestifer]
MDRRIGAGQHKLRLMADGQHRARQHARPRGTALHLPCRDQAQLIGRIRQADGGVRYRAVRVQRRLHAGRQRERAGKACRDRVLAVGHLQAPLRVQAGGQGVQVIPRRGGVGAGNQLARVWTAHGDAQRYARRVDHDAGADCVQQVLNGAHAFQADIDPGISLVREQEGQRRAFGRRIARGQVRQVGLCRHTRESPGVDDVGAAALHHEAEVIHIRECAVDIDATLADPNLAVVQGHILAARGQLDGVRPGRTDHLGGVGVADDEVVGQAGRAVQHGLPRKARGVDPIAVFAADDAGTGDSGVSRRGGQGLAGRTLDPGGAAGLLERHITHAATCRRLRHVVRAIDARQAISGHHEFGGGVCARAARDRIAPAQEQDLMLGVGARARLDDPACHQAADQYRIAGKGGRIDQRRTQPAIEPRVAEHAMQGIDQRRVRQAGSQWRAVSGIRTGELRVGQREIPFTVFVQRIAERARLGPQFVRALIPGEGVVAQTAPQDVGARAANQGQIAEIVRAVQRDDSARMIGSVQRRGGVDGAIVLQGHGVHAAQGHGRDRACAHGRVRQRGRGLVAAKRGVAFHARNVFGCAADGQVADHQIVAAATADAVLSAAVGHGDDVVAQAADDVVAVVAARADDIADVQHARQAAGVVKTRIAVLEVQVDGDVVFVGRVVQRGLAGHAEEHLNIKIADQRGRACHVVDAAVCGQPGAQEDADAAPGLHAGRHVGAKLGKVQGVAALASLLGQGESESAARDDVGVAAAAAGNDVLRAIDGDGRVAYHRDLVAALRGTLDCADRPHVAESGRRRRRNFFAIGVCRGAGQIDRDAGCIAAVVQKRLAVQGGADQVEGLVADLQALRAVGRLEQHVDRVLGPVVVRIDG